MPHQLAHLELCEHLRVAQRKKLAVCCRRRRRALDDGHARLSKCASTNLRFVTHLALHQVQVISVLLHVRHLSTLLFLTESNDVLFDGLCVMVLLGLRHLALLALLQDLMVLNDLGLHLFTLLLIEPLNGDRLVSLINKIGIAHENSVFERLKAIGRLELVLH